MEFQQHLTDIRAELTPIAESGDESASAALSALDFIESQLKSDGTDGDAYILVLIGIILGTHLQTVRHIRPVEKFIETGKKVIEAASEGGKYNARLDDDEKATAADMVAELLEGGESKFAACQQVGRQFGVSYKTIERVLDR